MSLSSFDNLRTHGDTAPVLAQLADTDPSVVIKQRATNARSEYSSNVLEYSTQGGRTGRVRQRDIVGMTSQLAIMMRSGVDVSTALSSLAKQCRRPAMKQIIELLYEDVLSGSSFSQALSRHSKVFGKTYVASVEAGEASGQLIRVLGQLAQLKRSEMRLRSTIRTLMAYPFMLASVSGVVILGLILFVLPQFAKIFSDYDTPLPCDHSYADWMFRRASDADLAVGSISRVRGGRLALHAFHRARAASEGLPDASCANDSRCHASVDYGSSVPIVGADD